MYKLDLGQKHPEKPLYRLIATSDIPEFDVSAGDVGGWVTTQAGLSGGSWVGSNAVVEGHPKITGSLVDGETFIKGSPTIIDSHITDVFIDADVVIRGLNIK